MSEKQARSPLQQSENLERVQSKRGGTVNPQEGNNSGNVPSKSKKERSKGTASRKPPLPAPQGQSSSPKVRPTRASASRLALEESDDDNLAMRPMQPPQRRDVKEAHVEDRDPGSRTLSRTFSSSDTSFGSLPMPPALSFQLTDPISNTTPGAKAKTSASPSFQTQPHPVQQDDSISEEALSSGSNSIRSISTEGTANTLDLVLAKRYAAFYGGYHSDSERATEEENIKNGMKPPPPPPFSTKPKEETGCFDGANQILLEEKRRQAGGYISQDLERYTSTVSGQEDFEDEPDDEDTSLSAPEPPSLQLRGHYLRPGAYRMRQGEEGRHVDNDSLASSSLRTLSTLRTNIGIGIIEASLVEDDITPKRKGKRPEREASSNGYIPVNGRDNCVPDPSIGIATYENSNHGYVPANTHSYDVDDDGDCEILSVPPPPTHAFSSGAMTFVTTSTTCSHVVEAQPFDERHTIRAFFRRKKVRCMMFFLGLIFLLLTVGTIYAVTGFVFHDTLEGGGGDVFVVSMAPSSAPTSESDLQLEYFVRVAVPDYTREALRWTNSPQTKALQWLHNNTNLESYTLSRRLQRFALATFFFSTGGERRWVKNDGWLSDENECTWLSSEVETSVCKDNEFKVLALNDNGLRGTIAPEIALLSSLEFMRVQKNILTGFLPTTLGEMNSLREIRLCKCC